MDSILHCQICNNQSYNQFFIAKELMLGLNSEFEYFECANCRCIQIVEVPKDMDRYYPDTYYSYQQPDFATKISGLRNFIKKRVVSFYIGKFDLLGSILSVVYKNPFPWIPTQMANFNSTILDVGCGAGRLLLSMQRGGFQNLTGIDPYNKEDIFYPNGISIYKKDIFEINGKFDLIMLHHSFEHMENPKDILSRLHDLLKPQGTIIIRIPVANCFAWRKYHTNWVQLDAPRHFFLHTIKSISLLCNKCSLKVINVKYISEAAQFTGSEKYLKGLGYQDNEIITRRQLKAWQREAKRLNEINDGDTACFYLHHI
ncbi:MAG: class I SAM-dependent methyltransferase [Mariniphaga sp.]